MTNNKSTKKIWGRTQPIVSTPFYSKHGLYVEAGGYCSLHYHKQRANIFTIVTCEVEIIEFYGPRVHRTKLPKHGTYDVPSMVPHLFAVYSSGLMYEEYYPDRGGIVDDNDIIRLVEGGMIDVKDMPNLPYFITKSYNMQELRR